MLERLIDDGDHKAAGSKKEADSSRELSVLLFAFVTSLLFPGDTRKEQEYQNKREENHAHRRCWHPQFLKGV